MTSQEKSVSGWVGVTVGVLAVVAYVWSSATKVEEINSRSMNNAKKLDKIEQRNEARFIRVENKLDLILQKVR